MPQQKRLKALDDHGRATQLTVADRLYSGLIKKLRWALPILALLIVALLLIWPKIENELTLRRFAAPKIDQAVIERATAENRLENAKFSSVDAKGRPFTINSKTAVQDNINPDIIHLESPAGIIRQANGENIKATAERGTYRQKDQILDLESAVVVAQSDGTVMETAVMTVNLSTNDIYTDTPVTIDGPQGRIEAKGMDIRNDGLTTVFKGPAKLVINTGKTINPRGAPQ